MNGSGSNRTGLDLIKLGKKSHSWVLFGCSQTGNEIRAVQVLHNHFKEGGVNPNY